MGWFNHQLETLVITLVTHLFSANRGCTSSYQMGSFNHQPDEWCSMVPIFGMLHGCAHLPRHYACREPPFAIEDDVVGHGLGGLILPYHFLNLPPRDGLVFLSKKLYVHTMFVLFCFVLFCFFLFVCLFVCLYQAAPYQTLFPRRQQYLPIFGEEKYSSWLSECDCTIRIVKLWDFRGFCWKSVMAFTNHDYYGYFQKSGFLKMDGENIGKAYFWMDDLGVQYHYFRNPPYSCYHAWYQWIPTNIAEWTCRQFIVGVFAKSWLHKIGCPAGFVMWS